MQGTLAALMSKMDGKQGVALFDLDQTLVPWDTQLLFCNWVLKHEGMRRLYLLVFLPFLPLVYVLGGEGMKRVFLSFLLGMKRERVEELVGSFVERYVPAEFYGELLEEVAKEKAKGRLTVLTSASPEMYARPIGEALGFDVSFGTRVEYGETVGLFPDFTRGNNKGAVKVARFEEELGLVPEGGKFANSAGYSDSKADLPMLELCEEVTAVHPEGMYAERAEREGWRVMTPPRPWRDRRAFGIASMRMMLGVFPV
jgi:phosphatidylglycerophosphatase C